MTTFLLKRLAVLVPTFLVIVTVVFFLLRIAPGGPFDGERRLPSEVEANLLAHYDLDQPLYAQYLSYLGNLVKGDLGPSFRQKDFSVNELIAAGLPISLTVGGIALLLALGGGIAAGVLAALRQNRAGDLATMSIVTLGLALPSFVTAPLLVLLFGVVLGWLPVAGFASPAHFVLPCLALALPFVAAVARLTRASLIEQLALPHIRTALAKGLPRRRILLRHGMPNAMIPVISFLGPAAAALLAGSVVIEQVFSLPGIGRYFVQGALNRDYTLVMGVVVVYASLILAFNLVADLCYAVIDPRIRAGLATTRPGGR